MSEHGGIYRGSVHDINDPEKRGRLRLLVPDVLGDAPSAWAEPVLPTSDQIVWRVGDRVWAQFESGDVNRPVYQSRPEVRREDVAPGVIQERPTTPAPTIYAGPGAAVVTWEASEDAVYDLYVVSTVSVSDPTGSTAPVGDPVPDQLHPEGEGILPPAWIRTYSNGSTIEQGDIVWFSLWARNTTGDAVAPSPWVQGTIGLVDPNNLLLTIQLLIANNLIAEAIKVVDLYVSGDLTAYTLTATGKAAFRAPDNELGPGAKWILQKGTTAPATPTSVTGQSIPSSVITGNTFGTKFGGSQVDGTYLYVTDYSGMTTTPVKRVPLAGGAIESVGPTFTSNTIVSGAAKLGSNWFLLVWNPTGGTWDIRKYDTSWAYQSTILALVPGSTIYQPVLGTDGTNLIFAYRNPTTYAHWFRQYNTSGVLQGSAVGGSIATSNTQNLRSITGGNFDYGVYRYIAGIDGWGVMPFDNTGARNSGVTTAEWNISTSAELMNGLGWDPTSGQFVHLDLSINRLFTFTKDWWNTGYRSSSRYLRHTWTDGTHETDAGPPAYFMSNKRVLINLATPAIPDGSTGFRAYMGQPADATVDTSTDTITSTGHGFSIGDTVQFGVIGTTNLKTATTYYIVTITTNTFKVSTTKGGTALNITGTTGQNVNHSPSRTQMWRVGDFTGNTGVATSPPVLGTPSANPPATNGYPDSSPSEVKSSNETVAGTPDVWIKGDGHWYLHPSQNLDDTGWVDLSGSLVAGDSPFTGTAVNWYRGRRIGKLVRIEMSRAAVAGYTPSGGSASVGNFANIMVAGAGSVPTAWRPGVSSPAWPQATGAKFDDSPVTVGIRVSDGAVILQGGFFRTWSTGDNIELNFQFLLD